MTQAWGEFVHGGERGEVLIAESFREQLVEPKKLTDDLRTMLGLVVSTPDYRNGVVTRITVLDPVTVRYLVRMPDGEEKEYPAGECVQCYEPDAHTARKSS